MYKHVDKSTKTETLSNDKFMVKPSPSTLSTTTVPETLSSSVTTPEIHHLDVMFQSNSTSISPLEAEDQLAHLFTGKSSSNEPSMPSITRKEMMPTQNRFSTLDHVPTRSVPLLDLKGITNEIHHALMADDEFPVNDMEEYEQYHTSCIRKGCGLNVILENETLPDE